MTPLLTMVSLAALAEGPLHAYMLKKRIDMGLGKMITVSEGSLYPLLRKLEERGLINSHTESAEHGRPDRVVYAITETGRGELLERLSEPLHEGPLGQTDFYVRVACFRHLTPESRRLLISERRDRLHQEVEALKAAQQAVARYPGHLELADLRERQLRTELGWLDDLEVTSQVPTKEVDS